MKGRWKWVFLFLGIFLISATCGFGYEAKARRTQFEEAKDAFEKRDWDRVVENLSEKKDVHVPLKPVLKEFLHHYVDPAIDDGKYVLASRNYNSTMVPIPNEEVSYQITATPKNVQLVRLVYNDDVLWMTLPIGGKMFGIFQGKQVTISFYSTFFRIALLRFPQGNRADRWKSTIDFVRSEKENLTKMGVLPTHLYSKSKNWDDFLKEYAERASRGALGSKAQK